jgi:hypothetical protein
VLAPDVSCPALLALREEESTDEGRDARAWEGRLPLRARLAARDVRMEGRMGSSRLFGVSGFLYEYPA